MNKYPRPYQGKSKPTVQYDQADPPTKALLLIHHLTRHYLTRPGQQLTHCETIDLLADIWTISNNAIKNIPGVINK